MLIKAENYNDSKLFEWNLCYIAEWMAVNFKFFLSNRAFPKEIIAKNSIEFVEKMDKLEPEFDTKEYWDWCKIQYDWHQSHCLAAAYDGVVLPILYFNRVNDYVEICWNSEGAYDDRGILFKHPKGCEYIEIKIFKQVLADFLNDFIARFKDKYPEEMNKLIEHMN
jgi:hypothetical protein